jgi:hypothetical protein
MLLTKHFTLKKLRRNLKIVKIKAYEISEYRTSQENENSKRIPNTGHQQK